MAMFPAFLDTCALYGAYLCDSLLRLAEAGTYRPLWSVGILDELERALVARELESKAVTHRISEMHADQRKSMRTGNAFNSAGSVKFIRPHKAARSAGSTQRPNFVLTLRRHRVRAAKAQ